MFCIADLEPPFTFSFKVPEEMYEELSVREGFMPAPYLARAKWVLITQPSKVTKGEWEKFIKTSYELIASKLTKKQKTELGLL
jgi:predicted DNA-binding protein (MmcQ/YjbR family)